MKLFNNKHVELALIRKFGIRTESTTKQQIQSQLLECLTKAGIAHHTGRYSVKSIWCSDPDKVIALLKQYGIDVEPEVKIDCNKLSALIKTDLIPEDL